MPLIQKIKIIYITEFFQPVLPSLRRGNRSFWGDGFSVIHLWCDFSKKVSHSLRHFDIKSPISSECLWRFKRCSLAAENMSQRVDFEIKALCHLQFTPTPIFMVQDLDSQLPIVFMPGACCYDSPSWWTPILLES